LQRAFTAGLDAVWLLDKDGGAVAAAWSATTSLRIATAQFVSTPAFSANLVRTLPSASKYGNRRARAIFVARVLLWRPRKSWDM